jgi:hypothetical protein
MRGPARGPGVTRALVAIAVVSIVATACDRTSRDAADDQPPAASTPRSSPCATPALEPGYLPKGVEATDHPPLFAKPERTRTWEEGDVIVQLLEGFSADHGDDPSVKRTNVRGDDDAHLASIESEAGDVLLVDWAEDTRCGRRQYAVASMGIDEKEALKVARSLEDEK